MGGTVSKEDLEKKHVVIVGGGYGGSELAMTLQKWDIPFTLIDSKEYFHHNLAALRCVVDEPFLPKTAIDYKESLKGNRHRRATVVDVDQKAKTVTLDSGDILEYTDLVIAVGSRGEFPARTEEPTFEGLKTANSELSSQVKEACSVIVVGGGPVGVEFAGEIADKYPEKQVSIIHSGSFLVSNAYGDAFQNKINSVLRSKNIQALLEEKVTNLDQITFNKCEKQTVETNKGRSYSADIVVKCIGLRPNTSLTRKIFDASKFDNNDRIKVTPELLVMGEKNIYAIGDCCDTKEEKLAAHAGAHARAVAWNIWRDIKGQEPLPYKQEFSGMLLTIGSRAGAGVINGWNLPSFAVGIIKGRSLFSPKFWALMEQKMPN